MASPVSPVVANLCMKVIESTVIETATRYSDSKLMCLGNLHTQTGISTLIHTTTLDTKLAQLEPLYTERKHYQVHILGYPDRDLTSKTLIP